MIRVELPRRAAFLAAVALCLTGCQQISSWLPKQDKVAEARSSAAETTQSWSGTVTPEQKIGVQMAVAQSLEHDGQIDDAINVYLDVVKKDNRRIDAYCRLARLYARKGDWGSAKKYYQIALKKEPGNAELHCDLGYCYYLQMHFKESEASLRKAIELQPNHVRAHNNLGLLLARTRREDDALKEFAAAGCSEAEAHANLGLAYSVDSRWSDANVQYRMALSFDPNLVVAHKGLAALQSLDARFSAGIATQGMAVVSSDSAVQPAGYFMPSVGNGPLPPTPPTD
jgi:Tfp pilus assembly protein PilF